MAATTVYTFVGSLAQFAAAAATAGTALNTNLTAGYLLQAVTAYGQASDGAPNFLWTFQTGGVAL